MPLKPPLESTPPLVGSKYDDSYEYHQGQVESKVKDITDGENGEFQDIL